MFNANVLAKRLHPAVQHCLIESVTDHGDAKSFVLVPDEAKGTQELAFFRASQYVSVTLNIDGALVHKPYTIRSGPADALGTENTSYTLTIKRTNPAYASAYILDNWKAGDCGGHLRPARRLLLPGPARREARRGRRRRQRHHALLLHGRRPSSAARRTSTSPSSTAPARRTASCCRDEIEEVAAKSGGRVKVVHVLSDEEREGYEHGFVTAELIKKYAGDGDYSVLMCGPKAMYDLLRGRVQKARACPSAATAPR